MEKILDLVNLCSRKSSEFFCLKKIGKIFRDNDLLSEENIKLIKEKANELEKLLNEIDEYQSQFNKGDIFLVALSRLELKEELEELGL